MIWLKIHHWGKKGKNLNITNKASLLSSPIFHEIVADFCPTKTKINQKTPVFCIVKQNIPFF